MKKDNYCNDINVTYFSEDYIGYGRKTDLSKMNITELCDELKMIDKQIKITEEEIKSTTDVPSYVLKEKLRNNEYYKNKVLDKITELSGDELNKGGIDAMIAKLDKQLEYGIITQEYHDKYVKKLDEKRELYDYNKEQQRKKQENSEKPKRHIFKKFKDKLSEYKK